MSYNFQLLHIRGTILPLLAFTRLHLYHFIIKSVFFKQRNRINENLSSSVQYHNINCIFFFKELTSCFVQPSNMCVLDAMLRQHIFQYLKYVKSVFIYANSIFGINPPPLPTTHPRFINSGYPGSRPLFTGNPRE